MRISAARRMRASWTSMASSRIASVCNTACGSCDLPNQKRTALQSREIVLWKSMSEKAMKVRPLRRECFVFFETTWLCLVTFRWMSESHNATTKDLSPLKFVSLKLPHHFQFLNLWVCYIVPPLMQIIFQPC